MEDGGDLMRFASADEMVPALEIWIDDGRSPVTVRLVGVLDRTTRTSLLTVTDELIVKGVRHFAIDAREVEIVDALGMAAPGMCQQRARAAGGTLRWDGVAVRSVIEPVR